MTQHARLPTIFAAHRSRGNSDIQFEHGSDLDAREHIWIAPLLLLSLNALVIRYEEAYLEKKFGDEYAGYRSRVRRWV